MADEGITSSPFLEVSLDNTTNNTPTARRSSRLVTKRGFVLGKRKYKHADENVPPGSSKPSKPPKDRPIKPATGARSRGEAGRFVKSGAKSDVKGKSVRAAKPPKEQLDSASDSSSSSSSDSDDDETTKPAHIISADHKRKQQRVKPLAKPLTKTYGQPGIDGIDLGKLTGLLDVEARRTDEVMAEHAVIRAKSGKHWKAAEAALNEDKKFAGQIAKMLANIQSIAGIGLGPAKPVESGGKKGEQAGEGGKPAQDPGKNPPGRPKGSKNQTEYVPAARPTRERKRTQKARELENEGFAGYTGKNSKVKQKAVDLTADDEPVAGPSMHGKSKQTVVVPEDEESVVEQVKKATKVRKDKGKQKAINVKDEWSE
ncbi:hypothetical protein GE09DRAFT_1231998 [Coniochaeta sp. 2T2.1]|nr:hypothetical protein GE09DRAFT_1231998 [Coniochaeta sp. 2T2.1]